MVMLQQDEHIEITANGGRQTRLDTRFDLLPFSAVMEVAKIMAFGASKHGDHNWRKILADSHLNHALRHIALYQLGNTEEDHASHAATRILMWLEQILAAGLRGPGEPDYE